jgi:hypothetical protein
VPAFFVGGIVEYAIGFSRGYNSPCRANVPQPGTVPVAEAFGVDIEGREVEPGSAGPLTFFITGGTMTFKGQGGLAQTVPISEAIDTGIPAAPGHYNTA